MSEPVPSPSDKPVKTGTGRHSRPSETSICRVVLMNDGSILEANEGFAQLVKQPLQDIAGQPVDILKTAGLTDLFETAMRLDERALQTDRPVGSMIEINNDPFEGPAWLWIICLPSSGKPDGTAPREWLFIDITADQLEKNRLRERRTQLENLVIERSLSLEYWERRFRTIVESANDAICLMVNNRLIYANPAATRLLGYSTEELIKIDPLALVDPSERDVLVEINRQLTTGDANSWLRETRLRHRDGRWIPMEVSAVMFNYEGSPAVHFTIRDITQRLEAEAEVQAYQKKLKRLASRQSIKSERERRRIAEYLHDDIGHSLAFCMMKLRTLVKEPVDAHIRETASEAIDALSHAVELTRDLTMEVSPPSLYEHGFAAAARSLAEKYANQHGFELRFEDNGGAAALPPPVAAILYRSVRETLMNIVKHAGARSVDISIRRQGELLVTTVSDDGSGFDMSSDCCSETSDEHFGLFSIRENLESLGGELGIESSPGTGTHVFLSVPLTDSGREADDSAQD